MKFFYNIFKSLKYYAKSIASCSVKYVSSSFLFKAKTRENFVSNSHSYQSKSVQSLINFQQHLINEDIFRGYYSEILLMLLTNLTGLCNIE